MRKRHRYVTVIQNGDTGQILAMVQHRNAAALSGFFLEQGPRWCRGVKVVVSDGSKSYKAAIDAHLGQTRHVLDRFHVIRWFAQGLTLVRRDLQRRQPHGVKPAFDPDIFRARFALLRRADHLNEHDQARLDDLFATHPRLRAGWEALQELHGLYLADDHDGALEALDRFTDLYATGELPEFHDVVDTIIAWSDEILAWHSAGRPSNGRIEGTNNLLQVLRRVAHGFTNPNNFAAPRTPRDMITPPKPADPHPTDSRRARSGDLGVQVRRVWCRLVGRGRERLLGRPGLRLRDSLKPGSLGRRSPFRLRSLTACGSQCGRASFELRFGLLL